MQLQFLCQRVDIRFNLAVTGFTVGNQIHLIQCKHKVPDSHQGTDAGMAAGLYQHTLRCIHQNDGKVCKGCANRHVAGIFLMSRRIRYNKAAVVRGKIPVSDINGNALFPLCHQAIQQQGIVNLTAAAADLAFQLQCLFLIGIQLLGII